MVYMTTNYRRPRDFADKKSKQVYSFISTFPKAHSDYEGEFECFDSYVSYITEPYTKPNHTRAYFKFPARPKKVTNTHRRVAAYCAPKTYCYDPYNEPKGDEWKRSSTLPKRIGGYQIIT